jgi:hypothetical protein
MYKGTITFEGGINTDDDITILPNGDYVAAAYSRSAGGIQGASGQLQSVTGNLFVANESLAAGGNRVIGTCPYTEANSLIYFVSNSLNNHSIWMINNETLALTKIAQSSVFNFVESYKINHAFVLDNKLFWTDGYFNSYENQDWNGPRRLDIPWAIGGATITRENISWDIYQPWQSPTATFDTDTSIPTNSLINKLFKFRYQWVLRTGEESVWSPISKVPISDNVYYVEGVQTYTSVLDNVLVVGVPTGSDNVTKLRIAYSENGGEFRLFKEVIKGLDSVPSDVVYDFVFTNDEYISVVSNAAKNNERFPRIAECVEIVPTEGSNLAAFANVYEGYDRDRARITATPVYNELDNVSGGYSRYFVTYTDETTFPQVGVGLDESVGLSFKWVEGDVLTLTIFNLSTLLNETINYKVVNSYPQATDVLKYTALRDDIMTYLTGLGYTVAAGTYMSFAIINVALTAAYSDSTGWYVSGTSFKYFARHNARPIKTYKTGASHQFAIQYYDTAQKDGTVWTSPTSTTNVPAISELGSVTSTFSNPRAPFSVSMLFSINENSRPPMWASHYQVMYKPPKMTWQQRVISGYTFTTDGRIKLFLENKYLSNFSGAAIDMVTQVGDVVRAVRKSNNQEFADPTTSVQVYQLAEYATDSTEYTISEVGASDQANSSQYIIIENNNTQSAFWPDNFTGQFIPPVNGLIEIYRVVPPEENDPWFEVGETHEIINPYTTNRVHGGDVNQVFGSVDAEVNLDGGNAYLRKRPQGIYNTVSNTQQYQMCYVEDPAFSDYFPSTIYDNGRIGIYDINAKEQHLRALVGHTGPYIDNTQVNRINQVDFQNVTYLREDLGGVNKILMNGFTLTCLQDRKNTSIYIQRTMSVDGVGGSNVIITDKVFGGVRPLDEDWGTIHAGSVVKVDNQVYYYDYYNATFVVSTGGGQFDVAKAAKFSKGAYDITQQTSPEDYISASISKNFDEAHFYFNTAETTLVYNFKQKRWKYSMNHLMDFQGAISQFHYTFKDGYAYVENAGTELTFMDELQTQSVTFAFNDNPTVQKFYLNLWLQTNVKWDVPSITTNSSLNAPNGMLSHLIASQFKNQENGYIVAGYRKDESDPAFEYAQIAYVSGRRLMGWWVLHTATYSAPVKSYLLAAAVNYSASFPINQ